MEEIIKETVTTQSDQDPSMLKSVPTAWKTTRFQTTEYLVYFAFGALEILLAFRLGFKLMGASLSSAFVGFIYAVSGIFIMPFEGIFRKGFAQGVETASVLEPSTMVAIIVYAIIAWGIVKLIRIFSREQQSI